MTIPPRFWRDRTVFVTGATGLLGPWIVGALVEQGAAVVCLVRDSVPSSNFYRLGLDRRVNVVRGDVCDRDLLTRILHEYEIQTVFHLAAQAVVGAANRSPIGSFDTNVRGTWSLLEAVRGCQQVESVVLASSDKAYGNQPRLPYTEDASLRGSNPYDTSKACADLIARSYYETFGTPVAITRCGNLFGGGDLNFSRLVPGTIRSAIRGERPLIRSNGRFVRDYLFVREAADAYLLLAERLTSQPALRGEAFNFSQERPMTVLEMVHAVLAALDSDLEPRILDVATNEISDQYLSAEKARTVLDWRARSSLEETLRETVAWYRGYFAEGEDAFAGRYQAAMT